VYGVRPPHLAARLLLCRAGQPEPGDDHDCQDPGVWRAHHAVVVLHWQQGHTCSSRLLPTHDW
jgi:hypothetical protein